MTVSDFMKMDWHFVSNRRRKTKGLLTSSFDGWNYRIVEHPVSEKELSGYDVIAQKEGTTGEMKQEWFPNFEAMLEGFDCFKFCCEEGIQ